MCNKPHLCIKWCAFWMNSNVCVILYLRICFVFVKVLFLSNKYLDNNSMFVYLLRRSTILVKRIRRIRHEHVWNKRFLVSISMYLLFYTCRYVFCMLQFCISHTHTVKFSAQTSECDQHKRVFCDVWVNILCDNISLSAQTSFLNRANVSLAMHLRYCHPHSHFHQL